MNARPEDFVQGATQVIDHYGDWPTLHDGLILTMNINCKSAFIEATFDLCDAEFPAETATRLYLKWEGVINIRLDSTNLDGVLYQMVFSETKSGIRTQFTSSTGGIKGHIDATHIKVTRYEPGEE